MVSIDDNEIENLRKILFEIFGEQNLYLNLFGRNHSLQRMIPNFSNSHEYIICIKKIENFKRNLLPRTEDSNKGYKTLIMIRGEMVFNKYVGDNF